MKPPPTPFSREGLNYLREIISRADNQTENTTIDAAEVARMRLLATLIGTNGNDQICLGVHDINLLYSNKFCFDFSNKELYALTTSALSHYKDENTPVWKWLKLDGRFSSIRLAFHTLQVGTPLVCENALVAMTLIKEKIPTMTGIERSKFIQRWLSQDSNKDIKNSALDYLSACGIPSDLPEIFGQTKIGDKTVENAAARAIINIKFRDNKDDALNALYELQPHNVDRDTLAKLFNNISCISTSSLEQGINHVNHLVRITTVKELIHRKAISIENAETLLNDTDAEIRFEVLKHLVLSGKSYSTGESKEILVKQKSAGVGLLRNPSAGENFYDQFSLWTLRRHSDEDLRKKIEKSTILDATPKLMLMEKNFREYERHLEAIVRDFAKSEFASGINDLTEKFGSEEKLIVDVKRLEDTLRKKIARQALNIICKNGTSMNLSCVREALREEHIDPSIVDLEFLDKHGEWCDIELILKQVKRRFSEDSGSSLLGERTHKFKKSATAIYSLGKKRANELISSPIPGSVLRYLILLISEKSFSELTDKLIEDLYRHEDTDVRKAAALKSIRALNRKRLEHLLNTYISSDSGYFYTVIHWLDLGLSLPLARARAAARVAIDHLCQA